MVVTEISSAGFTITKTPAHNLPITWILQGPNPGSRTQCKIETSKQNRSASSIKGFTKKRTLNST